MMNLSGTRKICLLGIGIAMFVALSLCLRVPVFENYYLCLGYYVMIVYCYLFGTVSGTVVGVLGTILYCVIINGLRGMPGWTLGNVVIGLSMGMCFKYTKKINKKVVSTLVNILCIILATFAGIMIVKSFTEVLLYGQPMIVRMTSNVYAFIADVVVLVTGIPLCVSVKKIVKKSS